MTKVFVKVLAEIDENGKKTPKVITFEGRDYIVDKVIDIKNRASMKVGGVGERYRVRIGGRETYIYYEFHKWFVEKI
jgi:hypothetical protein